MAWNKKPGNWKKGDGVIFADFSDLKSVLLGANIQAKNPNLYRTIEQLIDRSQQNKGVNQVVIDQFFGRIRITDDIDLSAILTQISTINAILNNSTFLTTLNEQFSLPSSRQLLAGTGITFDDTVPFERTINATGGGSGFCFVPLSQGIEPLTFMSDGLGQPILIPFVETP